MKLNVALYIVLRAASRLVPILPIRFLYGVGSVAGLLAYHLFPRPRQAIEANLSRVVPNASHEHISALARRAFQYDAMNWLDTLRIGALRDHEILETVQVEGWEHLEHALSAGKGVVLVVLHLGNMDLAGQVLAARGFPITVPAEHMQPEPLFELLVRQRARRGINVVPVDRAAREMLRRLRTGEIVATSGDRAAAGRWLEVDFFGQPARLPVGAVSLARRTGAPLVVGVGVRVSAAHFHGIITPPLPMQRTANAEEDDFENLRRLVPIMEMLIGTAPEQWLVFSPVWREDRRARGVATIGQSTEAAV
jgi:lauroyl/myristoyl acyltransferase